MRQRAAAAGVLLGAVLLAPAATAAQAPERTGWWNRLSAGDVAVPQPTTADGDLRVASAPDGPSAYAAVHYPSQGATRAVLTLALRTDRTVGTPDVLACVVPDPTWEAGGNQPFSTAPEYDCDAGSAFSVVAPDGASLRLLLDATTQDGSGAWSLALVPAPGSAPFVVELAAPEPDAFVAQEPDPVDGGPGADPAPSSADSGPVGTGTADLGSSSGFTAGDLAALPAFDGGGTTPEPLLPSAPLDAPAAVATGPRPQVAAAGPGAAGAPRLPTRPVAAVGQEPAAGPRLLALLVLAGGCGAVGWAAGQQRPGPRLIGGRARVAAGGAPAAAAGPPPTAERPRGIGRFARDRVAAPRRLR